MSYKINLNSPLGCQHFKLKCRKLKETLKNSYSRFKFLRCFYFFFFLYTIHVFRTFFTTRNPKRSRSGRKFYASTYFTCFPLTVNFPRENALSLVINCTRSVFPDVRFFCFLEKTFLRLKRSY